MAHMALQMNAIGAIAEERCDGCGKAFARGEQMSAIEYENGDKAGWFCRSCVDCWPTAIGRSIRNSSR